MLLMIPRGDILYLDIEFSPDLQGNFEEADIDVMKTKFVDVMCHNKRCLVAIEKL
jgi:hypothetical protein